MKFSELKLPSNRKFGFFFVFVFFLGASYFFLIRSISIAYALFFFGVAFLSITLINANALFPLNKLWMRFGQLLGMIINPIVLGVIFFLLITPYSLIMSLFGRDELQLKFKKKKSYWKLRKQLKSQTNFKQQF